ncbi:proton-conducting transporter transmembrane domain-containing protein [Botrimarina hoheduenensis]|uniref:NADH-quinone oxidoreductase subunit 12 n=1 Tax=Botrimarina hoheduenensis TaxID=2528000 RepID=A0A5C5VS42_9BACT|nr:proton-conducting transporter membrane subunit [Botrimarina hoheduenensis]TWT40755.1 NADH-quinone oxidoreductase subunit 12 [Botrimarina hoheduenensis]
MSWDTVLATAGLVVVIAPSLLVLAFCATALFTRQPSERLSARLTQAAVLAGLLASSLVLFGMLTTGNRNVIVELGEWVSLHPDETGEAYHFHLKFVFDRLSVPFVLLTFILVGTVGAFANNYLHREKGYGRFFALYSLFLLGMVTAILAGTVETLFLGWELVGLSSALLVAFFHDRTAPVQNGQRVWTVYRVADAAFLIAAIAMHQLVGGGDFAALTGEGAWPYAQASIAPGPALAIGLLLLIAAAGKSALFPFCEWLPRAMEGPTPSSAVFYGALSVHLGAYLLLRVSPLIQQSVPLAASIIALGAITAVYGAVVTRAQTDIKSALAFASLTQVGLITIEIGLGWQYLALIHILGHASFRTLQLLRAPSVLQDHQSLENALGGRLNAPKHRSDRSRLSRVLYRFAHRRGQLDGTMDRYLVTPLLSLFSGCQQLESRWLGWLAGPENGAPLDALPKTTAEASDLL